MSKIFTDRVLLLALMFLSLYLSGATQAGANELVGRYWFPDENGQVEIYENEDGTFSGKVVAFDIPDQRDENNPDPELRGQPYVGSLMFKNFSRNDKKDRWDGGTIYDAESGKIYKCRIWFKDDAPNVLRARGYVGTPLLGRTELFKRVTTEDNPK